MDERLDYLLSVALDDELDFSERDELDRLRSDSGDSARDCVAAARSASFERVDDLVRSLAATSLISSSDPRGIAAGESDLEAGIAAIRARLEAALPEEALSEVERRDPGDELASRRRDRRWLSGWIPPFAMAAAAIAIYLAFAQVSFLPIAPTTEHASDPSLEVPRLAEDPIALAVVFELDDDADSIELVEGMSADDFEIIETLELMEFLAAHEMGARG